MLPTSGVASTILPVTVVPSSDRPSVLGAAIVSGLGTSVSIPTGDPSTSVADVVGNYAVPPILSIRGKGQVACPSTSDDFEESNSEPLAPLAQCSRPYA